jgi:hypothetical protein
MMRPLTLALALLCALLAGAALWPWFPASEAAPRLAETAAPAGEPKLAGLPPFADFSAAADRPLFSPSRRPTPNAVSFSGGIADRYRLQGLLVAGKSRRAQLVEIAGGRIVELGEGDKLEGWTVKKIEQDRLVLSSATGEATLTVRRPPGKP